MNRAAFVGEPTGGSTGQPLNFNLPGGRSARPNVTLTRMAKGLSEAG